MSWLLFLDESGHDHKHMPYEVRGGVAIHAARLWPFVQAMQRLELDTFGCAFAPYGKELKGSTLVDRKRFRFAGQGEAMADEARRKNCRGFLTKGLQRKTPCRDEFTAYGQACIRMAEGTFQLLWDHEAVAFAAAIPCGLARQPAKQTDEFLRKDQVFLLERFFYLLEEKREHGLLVMDAVERAEDRSFVRRIERYFTKTEVGRYRTAWIVPTPFFVSSDMTYGIEAADLCIYCINWGFRLPSIGMDAAGREEITVRFGPRLTQLQYRGEGYRDGKVFTTFGIVYVPDPFAPR